MIDVLGSPPITLKAGKFKSLQIFLTFHIILKKFLEQIHLQVTLSKTLCNTGWYQL
jgi:hypothetical protein